MPKTSSCEQPAEIIGGHLRKRLGISAAVKVLEGALSGRRFSWPPNAPALAYGGVYELVLFPKASGAQPIKMSFRATALSDQHEQQVLIRVD